MEYADYAGIWVLGFFVGFVASLLLARAASHENSIEGLHSLLKLISVIDFSFKSQGHSSIFEGLEGKVPLGTVVRTPEGEIEYTPPSEGVFKAWMSAQSCKQPRN